MNIEQAQIGQRIVIALLVGAALLSVAMFLFVTFRGVPVQMAGIVRLGLTTLLLWQTYQGRNWARYILGALLILTGLSALLVAIQNGTQSSPGFILVLSALLYLSSGFSLLFLPQVNAYFRHVNTR